MVTLLIASCIQQPYECKIGRQVKNEQPDYYRTGESFMAAYMITDSTAYLDPDYIREKHIRVVPLSVILEDRAFKEGYGMSNREYFSLLRARPIYPKTSQPAAGDFLASFQEMAPDDEVLVLLISSQISGTVQSAMMARDMLEEGRERIHIIDSRQTAGALMMLAGYAQELIDSGLPMNEVLSMVEAACQKTKTYFVVINLEYLVRGGRLGNLARVFANIMQIKPVLQLKEGRIELYQKIRTRHQAVNHLLELLEEDAGSIQRLALMHVDCADDAAALADRIRAIYKGEFQICDIGPVIGSHVGPGTLGITWF